MSVGYADAVLPPDVRIILVEMYASCLAFADIASELCFIGKNSEVQSPPCP